MLSINPFWCACRLPHRHAHRKLSGS